MSLLKSFWRFKQPEPIQDPNVQPCTTAPQQNDNEEDRPPSSYSTQDLLPNTLADRNVRKTFILRVCLLLGVQFLLIFSFAVGFLFVGDIVEFAQRHSRTFFALIIVSSSSSLTLLVFQHIRRTFPWNLIFLSLETLSFTPFAGLLIAHFRTDFSWISLSITTAICIAVTIFSIKTTCDLTVYARVQTACVVVFSLLLIPAVILQREILDMVLAFIAIPLFTWTIALNIQMILGNKKRTFTPADYIWADLLLHRYIFILFFCFSLIILWLGDWDIPLISLSTQN
ncbi:protein lifeguard 1-like [Hemicordylus capensis]|uniref:protein lifeguard 1-like n=1 Tax=Hemicordylus capensis TaxID=884348 RepID=UPI002303B82A|nr:protein lifeguard 1-like [Hemicordylus capensis]XP_053101160.1 protein lifeguard 1-like [Hemicordylus capensis]XP_053101161.1 protein lifeguard 1-like [Hemicordylus capensis]